MHSLAYLRQVLRQHGLQNMKMRMPHPPQVPAMDDIMPTKNARNMALFFTFLGAASYMHGSAPEMPDPSDVINAENVAALRDVFLKMGLAGGVLKTMKEAAAKTVAGNSANNTPANEANNTEEASRSIESRPRPSSIGSFEDLTQMLPATITSRLYNAFSPTSSLPNMLEQKEESEDIRNDAAYPLKQHRSKRSHSTSRLPDAVNESKVNDSKQSPSSPSISANGNGNDTTLTPEVIANAMKHPVSSNPYDHRCISVKANTEIQPASLFSFHAISNPDDTKQIENGSPLDSGEIPSGCVGGTFFLSHIQLKLNTP